MLDRRGEPLTGPVDAAILAVQDRFGAAVLEITGKPHGVILGWNGEATGFIYITSLAVQGDQRQTFVKIPAIVKNRGDDKLARTVDKATFAVYLNRRQAFVKVPDVIEAAREKVFCRFCRYSAIFR